MGGLLARQEQFEEAIKLLEEATALEGDVDEVFLNLGLNKRALGDYESARTCFERALQLTPDYPDASANLSDINHALKIKEELTPLVTKCIFSMAHTATEQEYLLESCRNLHRLLLGHLENGRLAAQLQATELASSLFPGEVCWALEYGQCLRLVGRDSESERVLLDAYDGEYLPWRFEGNLGRLYWDTGRYSEAERWYRKAIASWPDRTDAYVWLSEFLFAQERFAEAIEVLGPATSLQGDTADVYLTLAKSKRAINDYEGAKSSFEQVLEFDPSNELAQAGIDDIDLPPTVIPDSMLV